MMGIQAILTLALFYQVATSTPTSVYRQEEDIYDYIIAGGGTSGLVLANRLSASGQFSVAVVEPGEDVSANPNVTLVASTLPAIGTQLDWKYPVSTQQFGPDSVGQGSMTWRSGKAIGGSSTINGMGYVRGDRAIIDAWETLGNPGWNWDTLLPYYIKSQNFTAPTIDQESAGALYEPKLHGTDGPLAVAFAFEELHADMYQTVQHSWDVLGYPVNNDINQGDVRGFSIAPMTVQRDSHLREDAGTAYYHPVKDRANLVMISGSVRKINWKDSTGTISEDEIEATGIEYVTADKEIRTLKARKEIILAAGVIKTPLILELSGIGSPTLLASHNITARVDLPGVGENLQDKPQAQLLYSPVNASENPFNITDVAPYITFANAHDLLGDSFAFLRDETAENLGAWAAAISAVNNVNASAIETILRIQHDLIFAQNSSIAEVETTIAAAYGLYVSVFWPTSPFSRGSVHISPTYSARNDSSLPEPNIDPKYLLIPFDTDITVRVGRLAAESWTTSPMSQLVGAKLSPDETTLPSLNATASQWRAFVEGSVTPVQHGVGTASLLPRELGGVVDPNLKVYGTANVRVVDASIIPLEHSGHLMATVYAVAERAADLVLGI